MIGAIQALAGIITGASPLSPAKPIIRVDGKQLTFKGLFINPTELDIDHKNHWTKQATGGGTGKASDANAMTYAGSEDKVKLDFILDATDYGKVKVDLKDDLEMLYHAAMPRLYKTKAGEEHRPAVINVDWGSFQFTGVLENVDAKVTLLDHYGKFKRASVSLKMKGAAFKYTDPKEYLDKLPPPPKKADVKSGGGSSFT